MPEQNRRIGASLMMSILSSSWTHVGIVIIFVIETTSVDIINYDNPIGLVLILALLATAISGTWINDDHSRGRRFYLSALLAWLVSLSAIVDPHSQSLYISAILLIVLSLYVSQKVQLIAGLSVIVAIELGWMNQVGGYLLNQLAVPLTHMIGVLAITVAIVLTSRRLESSEAQNIGEREKLNALVNSMADGVIGTDQLQKVTIYNGAALNILNINLSLEGQPLENHLKLIDPKDKPVDIFKLSHKSRTSYVSRDLRLVMPDEDPINLYISVAPVRTGYGQASTLGYIILLRDITKEKSLEEERDEFISVVSHELRTPITVAEGSISNAQLLVQRGEKSKAKQSLDEAHKNAVFLSEMINDLAMLSRAERGKLKVDPESIDIVDLIKTMAGDYQIEAKQKKLKLVVKKMPAIKPVNSAPLYVKEILQNFITNAIKYTEKGSITIWAKHTNRGVDVMVKDTGIGISKSDQSKLFEKFYRSEDYRTRQSSGTGLGLYVTKKLASLIGARIEVESKLNSGSTFTIHIPNLEAHHHHRRS